MEEEFVANQERLKPQEERNEEERTKVRHAQVHTPIAVEMISLAESTFKRVRTTQVDELRGSPMSVGSLEEIIDEKCDFALDQTNCMYLCIHMDTMIADIFVLGCSHAIVSSLVGPEYYVNIMSFVDKSQLEPGCSILLHNKVCFLSLPTQAIRGLELENFSRPPSFVANVIRQVKRLISTFHVPHRCCQLWASCRMKQIQWCPS